MEVMAESLCVIENKDVFSYYIQNYKQKKCVMASFKSQIEITGKSVLNFPATTCSGKCMKT